MSIFSTPLISEDSRNPVSSCCPSDEAVHPWIKQVDTICRIAIAVFAVVIDPVYFAVSFTIGTIAGAAYAASRYIQHKVMYPEGKSKPVCAQGYMDFLAGMRFPPPIGTLATAEFIGAHMRHDPKFYVPFCGLFLGFFVGRESVSIGKDLGGRLFNKVEAPCCCSVSKTV